MGAHGRAAHALSHGFSFQSRNKYPVIDRRRAWNPDATAAEEEAYEEKADRATVRSGRWYPVRNGLKTIDALLAAAGAGAKVSDSVKQMLGDLRKALAKLKPTQRFRLAEE